MKNMQASTTSQPLMDTAELSHAAVSSWRTKGITAFRITFGLIWLVAAWLKWQPDFIRHFSDLVAGAAHDQPGPIQTWIGVWVALINTSPQLFAYGVAITETILAICLLFGLLSNLTYLVGILYTLGIWSVAEGFGGPYIPGQSTDVGAALLYAVLFGVLFCISAGRYTAVDQWLTPRLGRWGVLASASLRRKK